MTGRLPALSLNFLASSPDFFLRPSSWAVLAASANFADASPMALRSPPAATVFMSAMAACMAASFFSAAVAASLSKAAVAEVVKDWSSPSVVHLNLG